MGLDELEQSYKSPIKSPRNPPRSCRQNSMLTSTLSEKKKRAEQELPNSPASKRSRTLRPRRGSSTKKEDGVEEEKPPPCVNTYTRKRRYHSVKPILRCSSSVRQNAPIFESSESAIGDVQGEKERRRSIGIQVDIGVDHLGDSLLEVSAFRDEVVANPSDARASTASHNLQLSPVGLNMEADVYDHISSEEIALLEIGDPVTKSYKPDGLASDCDVVMENGKCQRDITWENEEARSDGDTRVEIKVSTTAQNSPELKRCLDLDNRDQETTSPCYVHSHEGHDKDYVNSSTSLPQTNPEGSDVQQAPLLDRCDLIVKSHELAARIVSPVLNWDPVLGHSEGDRRGPLVIHSNNVEATNTYEEYEEAKSAKSGGDMRAETKVSVVLQNELELNRFLDPDKGDQGATSSCCHPPDGNHGVSLSLLSIVTERSLESSSSQSIVTEPIGPQDVMVFTHPITRSCELDADVGLPALKCDPVSENSVGVHGKNGENVEDRRGSVVVHGKNVEDTDTHEENEDAKSYREMRVETKFSVLQNELEFNQFLDPLNEDQEAASSYCPTNEKHGGPLSPRNIQASIHLHERSLESSSLQSIVTEPIGPQEVMVSTHPITRSCELDADVGLPALNCDLAYKNNVGMHQKNGEGPERDGGNEEVKSGEGMGIELKPEERSVHVNYLGRLSLRKLRSLCKENMMVIKCESKRGSLREEGRAACEEENMVKAKFDGLSLRKLKFLCKKKMNKKNSNSEVQKEATRKGATSCS